MILRARLSCCGCTSMEVYRTAVVWRCIGQLQYGGEGTDTQTKETFEC